MWGTWHASGQKGVIVARQKNGSQQTRKPPMIRPSVLADLRILRDWRILIKSLVVLVMTAAALWENFLLKLCDGHVFSEKLLLVEVSTPGKVGSVGTQERGQLSDILTFPPLSRRPSVESGDSGFSRCCPDSSLTIFLSNFFRDGGSRTEMAISLVLGVDVLLRMSMVMTGGFSFGVSDIGELMFVLRLQPGKDSDFGSRSIRGIVFRASSKFGFKLSWFTRKSGKLEHLTIVLWGSLTRRELALDFDWFFNIDGGQTSGCEFTHLSFSWVLTACLARELSTVRLDALLDFGEAKVVVLTLDSRGGRWTGTWTWSTRCFGAFALFFDLFLLLDRVRCWCLSQAVGVSSSLLLGTMQTCLQ